MRVVKWIGSLAVRLPKSLVEKLGLGDADDVAAVETSKKHLIADNDERRRQAVAGMGARAWSLPERYRFDRNEANQR